ncbi:MAG: hypothetical protein K2V38_05415 [Gemmataceae bacterium]|nr:hypothetical protein [Gemmataceae bacterium]
MDPASHDVAGAEETVSFKVTHSAAGEDHTITSAVKSGGTNLHSYPVTGINVKGDPPITSSKAAFVIPKERLLPEVVAGTYTPSPGGNKVVILVQRKKDLKTVFVKEAVLVVRLEAKNNALIQGWEAGLPAIDGGDFKLVVRALLLDWQGKVLGTTTVAEG